MLYHLLYPLSDSFQLFNVFRYITFRTIYAIVTAMVMSFLIAPWFIRRARAFQVRQYIREDGPASHQVKAGTPTMGGVFILSAVLASSLLWSDLTSPFVWLVILVAFSFGLIGFADDYLKIKRRHNQGLTGRGKLIWQVLVAALAGLFLYLYPEYDTTVFVPFFKGVKLQLGPGYVLLAILVIVCTSNAVNLTDGLDGLAIGPFLIAMATYMVLSYLAGHVRIATYLQVPYVPGAAETTVVCGALVGASAGFLWFNAYPAQVFMGDVGSLSLGAVLGTVALLVKHELLLILIGGIFVLEAISVIMQVGFFKATGGKRIFKMAPLHHHFELKGWPEPKVIVRFWIIAGILSLIALSTLKLR
ncbi:MAG: phospho-N-acetylmuramoyl-pentapeptide-transferase [Thermodesulfobacteriota bacterium]